MKTSYLIAAVAAVSFAPAAIAQDTGLVIREGVQPVEFPNGQSTIAYDSPGERRNGGFAAVTRDAPRAAPGTPGQNGSLKISGDRSRYVIGSIYETFLGAPAPSLVNLSQVSTLSFDWRVNNPGQGFRHASPAVRLHIMDQGVRSEMIWEHVYNGGTSGQTPPTGWQTAPLGTSFYLNVRDNDGAAFLLRNPGLGIDGGTQGVVTQNGSQLNLSIEGWKSFFTSEAFVTGFSFGSGGGFGSDHLSFVDNVRIGLANEDTIIVNFESAIPEPGSWAMMIAGFGLAGSAMRRRVRAVAFA